IFSDPREKGFRLLYREASDINNRGTGPKYSFDIGSCFDAASEIDLERGAVCHAFQNIYIGDFTGSCPVEIHHVQPPQTGGFETSGGFERVVGVDRLSSKITLHQANAFTANQVHCGAYLDLTF